jgi:myo-inositol-1(or 4)-monophosphatase
MTTSLADLLAIAHRAIDLATPIIASRRPTTVTSKGDRDMVSDLDITVQERVQTFLAAETPHIRFLGEEQHCAPSDFEAPVWALDPVDGTANLVRGIPLCGVSLALVEHNVPVLGVIDLPLLDLRYYASRGSGAFGNGRQLRISTTQQLREAIVTVGDFAVGADGEAMNRLQLAITRRLAAAVLRIRMLGSAAIDLAWLASGKTDINVTLSNRPWDVGAGVIIAQEAGGVVMDLDGSPYSLKSTATLTVTPALRDPLMQLIREAARVAVEGA